MKPAPIQIVRARPDDAAKLTHIAFAAKRHWGYSEQWIQRWSNVLTIRTAFILAHETYLAIMDAAPVGFYSLREEGNSLHLEHLWVLPEVMGQGIGRALFLHAVERAPALGYARLNIESDPNAEPFYKRMGARRVDLRRTELDGQPRELPVLVYEIEAAPRDGEP